MSYLEQLKILRRAHPPTDTTDKSPPCPPSVSSVSTPPGPSENSRAEITPAENPDNRPLAPWPSVVLRDSKLGEPIVFAFDDKAASAPEIQALGYPIFTRAELVNLAGASFGQWQDAVAIKREAPDLRIGPFEVLESKTTGATDCDGTNIPVEAA